VKFVGVLLAAGASSRMGEPKQLLPFGERTVLGQGVHNHRVAGVAATVVVLGHHADAIRGAASDTLAAADVSEAWNERHEDGMFTSVQCGIRAAVELAADAVLMSLVDQPFVPPAVYADVMRAHALGSALVTIPTRGERRGHPVALSMDLREAILEPASPETTLRDVIKAHGERTRLVAVDADEILRDMDVPEEYARELRRWATGGSSAGSDD
jgi:molybdenum cofactor cytidylyltransferase